MNVYELIKKRRSIRAYDQNKNISEDILHRIIEAGTWAPSGKNLQNWQFHVLRGEKRNEYLIHSQKSWLSVKETLEKRLKPSLYKFTERFFFTMGGAPVIIIAFAKINDLDHPQTQVGNVYLAIQNIVLAAESEGLGTCVMGSPLEVETDVREFLGVTDPSLKLVCGLTIGYPAHQPPAPPRQLENRIIFH